MPSQPINMSRERLLEELDDIRNHVAAGDSLEGSFEYMLPENGAGYDVRAAYRVGNLLGQGGMRFIGDTTTPDATPDPAVMLRLIRDLASSESCWFDHHGGCQEHGYLSLEPGEKCPHAEAWELLGRDGGDDA